MAAFLFFTEKKRLYEKVEKKKNHLTEDEIRIEWSTDNVQAKCF